MPIRRCLTPEEQTAPLSRPVTPQQEELAKLAWALAHPSRVRIFSILRQHSACLCGDLVGRMPLSQSTIFEHLKTLREAGLVQADSDGARVCYSVNEQTLERLKTLVAEL
jgi:ArsR family transcriptional regulator